MAGKNLKVALEITADLNQARREVGNFRDEIVKTTKAANSATNTQDKMAQSAGNAAGQMQQMSKATDMKSSVNELKAFEKQLDLTAEASSKVAASNSIVEKSVKTLAPHFLALTAASGGFVAMAVDTLNKAAELQNLSSVTGLNVEQFQYSAAAAKTVGIEVDKLSQIFQDSRDKLGDYLAEGGGELQQFFDEIAPKVGVTAKQFEKLNGDQILQLYVKTLQEAGVSQNEMVTHMERLASDSTLLIPIYENNAAALKEIGDKAKASGAILSQELVDDAKKAKLALGEFTNELTGVSNQMIANAAPAITFLAENLDVLAQAGIIVTSVYVGRLAPAVIASTQATVAELTVKGRALFMSKARATALLAEATSAQAKTAAELRSAQAAMAVVATGSAQTAAQARLTAARAADTAAILAQSRAQSILDTTVSRSRITAGALIGALGGPVGLAVTAAGVAASFLLMRDKGDQVNDTLLTQSRYANLATEELNNLSGAQQRAAQGDLAKELDIQKNKLIAAKNSFEEVTESVLDSNKNNKEAYKIWAELRTGVIDVNQAFEKLNKSKFVSNDQINQLVDAKKKFNDQENAVKAANNQLNQVQPAANSATSGINKIGQAAKDTKDEISGLSKAFKDLTERTKNNIISNKIQDTLVNRYGYSEAQAKALTEFRLTKGSALTEQDAKLALESADSEDKKAKSAEKRRNQEEAISKELERQAKFSDLKIKSSEATAGGRTHQGTIELAKFVQDNFNIRHFSAFNDQYHQGKGGKHPQGLAFDFSLRDPKESQSVTTSLKRTLAELGVNAGIQDEYKNPSKNATGGHIHVSFATAVEAEKFMAMTKTENKMKFVGEDLQDFRKQTQQQLEEQKRKNEEKLSFEKQFYTEREKLDAEYQANLKKANELGYEPNQKAMLIKRIEEEYQDKLSKRPEILKRVQDQLSEIDQTWLRVSGNGIEADMVDIANKWKQTQADIAALLMSETDPEKAAIYQKMLLKIDFVIDQEQTTLQFNKAVDEVQKIQDLKNTRLNNLKVQYDSGQISRSQYSEQAKGVQQELQPDFDAATTAAGDAAGKMQGIAGKQASADVERLKSGWAEVNNEASKYMPTLDQIEDKMVNGMTDAIMAWADGTKSASEAFREFASSFLREIAQMILKQMIFNAIQSATNSYSKTQSANTGSNSDSSSGLIQLGLMAAKAYFGFAQGGYTGIGGKYEPAGFVHKGEVVWSQDDIKAWGGVGVVESMRKHRGYADGGIVSAPAAQIPSIQMPSIQAPQLNDNAAQIAQSTSFNASQNFYLVDDPKRILDTLNSSQGQENIVVMMSRDPSKFKAALKIGG